MVVVAVVLLGACASGEPPVAERAHRIESQVWSPYCPGRLLVDCTTEQAHELRATIESRLASGESPEEVLAWIRSNYGEEALARPGGGAGLAIWLVPAAALLAGLGAVALVVRRWRRRALPATTSERPPGDDPRLEHLRDDVRRDL